MEKISKASYIGLSLVGGVLLTGNTLFWHLPALGWFLGTGYVLLCSLIIGTILVPIPSKLFTYAPHAWAILFGSLFLLSGMAVFGALCIYLFRFTNAAFLFFLLALPITCYAPYFRTVRPRQFQPLLTIKNYLARLHERKESRLAAMTAWIYVVLAGLGWLMLYAGQTLRSIQTPWQTVPGPFLAVYFAATLALITYILHARRTKLPLLLLVAHTGLSFSVALIVYRIGYGYDPFIHQATERLISLTGTIHPKPLYYLGQYGIVLFLQKLFLIDLNLIDRILTPLLAALLLPTTAYFVFSHWLEKRFALLLGLSLLVIPFGTAIMSTPQNLANILFAVTILLSLLYFRGKFSAGALFFLAAATAAIHPIAGIPLLIAIALLVLFRTMHESYSQHLPLYALAGLVFALVLPVAFLLNGSGITLSLPVLQPRAILQGFWPIQHDAGLDLVYLLWHNRILLASLIILIGIWQLRQQKLLRNNAGYLVAAGVIGLNFLIVRYGLTFPALNDFDRDSFTTRLGLLILYTLLPIFLIGLHTLFRRFVRFNAATRAFLTISLAGLITGSLYLSYPRVDQYSPSKFYSLSSSDINAVRFIEQTASPNHVVLANQMVGAAAIKEFGFKKYFNGQFYYSMPNGNPKTLYDAYLDMIYQGAQRETMARAMAEVGVNESYFVLNRYWQNSDKIAEAARQSADEIILIDGGIVTIFKYRAL